VAFERTVRALVDHGLARRSEETMSVHGLVARAVRHSLDVKERQALPSKVRELLVRHLPGEVGSGDVRSEWRALMPHVLTATDAGPRLPDPNRTSWLLARAGEYLRTEGEGGAGQVLLRAVHIDEEVHGRDHPFVARRLSSLALTLRDLGRRPEEALPLLERALKIDEHAFGPDHPHVADDLRHLAVVMNDLGERTAARDLLNRALTIDETVPGPNSPLVVDPTDLDAVLNDLNELRAATMLHDRATQVDRATDAAGGPIADPKGPDDSTSEGSP
jgi:hypothetical protein